MPVAISSKITMTKNDLPKLVDSIRAMADVQVMVGIPMETTDRADGQPLNNAEIGYIQEFGAPEAHIPARPHLFPTVRTNKAFIIGRLKAAGRAALIGQRQKMTDTLEGLGLAMAARVKKTIVAVIPPPLAASTVEARILRRKSPSWRSKRRSLVAANVAAGRAPGEGLFTPLIDTSNYISHITYVLRSRRTKKDSVVGPVGKYEGSP
jgi:hypothetical protein